MGSVSGKSININESELSNTPKLPEFRFKTILLGSSMSGRSSIFDRYIHNSIPIGNREDQHLRLGKKIWMIDYPLPAIAILELWDTPYVDERNISVCIPWDDTRVLLVCVDAQHEHLQEEIEKWIQNPHVKRLRCSTSLCVCIAITKVDLVKDDDLASIELALRMCEASPSDSIDCWAFTSAKDDSGIHGRRDVIKQLFHAVIKRDQMEKTPKTHRASMIELILGGKETEAAKRFARKSLALGYFAKNKSDEVKKKFSNNARENVNESEEKQEKNSTSKMLSLANFNEKRGSIFRYFRNNSNQNDNQANKDLEVTQSLQKSEFSKKHDTSISYGSRENSIRDDSSDIERDANSDSENTSESDSSSESEDSFKSDTSEKSSKKDASSENEDKSKADFNNNNENDSNYHTNDDRLKSDISSNSDRSFGNFGYSERSERFDSDASSQSDT